MSRTRMLKPEFFQSRSLARVSRDARLTFQGLWVEADAAGRGVAHPAILKGRIWALDAEITPDVIDGHLQELSREHITLYQHGEDTLFAINSWEKHQSASYRTGEPKFPSPAECAPVVQLAPPIVQPARPPVHKEKGREVKGSEPAPVSVARANPLWDSLSSHFGAPTTSTERSNRGRQVKELTAADATPGEIDARVQEHKRRRLTWTLTANALVSHWSELAPEQAKEDRVWDEYTNAWVTRRSR